MTRSLAPLHASRDAVMDVAAFTGFEFGDVNFVHFVKSEAQLCWDLEPRKKRTMSLLLWEMAMKPGAIGRNPYCSFSVGSLCCTVVIKTSGILPSDTVMYSPFSISGQLPAGTFEKLSPEHFSRPSVELLLPGKYEAAAE